jgi:stage II sporulation protein P
MNRENQLSMPNLFILFSFLGSIMMIFIGLTVGKYLVNDPPSALKDSVSQISNSSMILALQLELPYFRDYTYDPEDPPMPLSENLLHTLINIEPNNLLSIMRNEIPGLYAYNPKVPVPDKTDIVVEPKSPSLAISTPIEAAKEEEKIAPIHDSQVVYIYNTHNTESWSYVTKNPDPDFAYNDQTNISLVGKKLSEELQKKGVKTKFDDTDIQQRLKEAGLPYTLSYAESLKVVKAALKQDKNINYIFDIHRDSSKREDTTIDINGKTYARVGFVIGKGNPHWQENDKLANKFQDILNQKYPGIANRVDHKSSALGNGEYNQSLSPNSLLIEVGGPFNTLEECYNTVSALAGTFPDLYYEKAKKVDNPTPAGKQPK